MTNDEMIANVETLIDDEQFSRFVPAYVQLAKDAVLSRVFPFEPKAKWEDIPEKYHGKTCEIAVFLINKRGAEGETSHSESGVSRSYESAGIPKSFFADIIPFAGVPCA